MNRWNEVGRIIFFPNYTQPASNKIFVLWRQVDRWDFGCEFVIRFAFAILLAMTLGGQAICVQTVCAQTVCSQTVCAQTVFAQTAQEGWHLFRGDQAATGVARSGLPDQLDVLWAFKQPQGAFESTPVIVPRSDGSHQWMVVVGDLDGHIFALDFATGEKLWAFKTEIGFTTAPAFRNGKLFIGDIDGIFYCLDSSGKELWRFETDGEISSSANFYQDKVVFGSQDASLYALSMDTGKQFWKASTDDQIRCSTTVASDRAFVAGCDGRLHVINLDEGKEIGQVEIDGPTGTTPAVLGDRVFFGTEQGSFFSVDWKKIKTAWVEADPRGGNSIRSSAAVTDQAIVYGARNRTVVCRSPANGKLKWQTQLKAKIDSSPVIAGEAIFVGSTDGRIYLLDLGNGRILWQSQVNGGVIGAPAVAAGRVVIATDRGVVYCLGSKTPASGKPEQPSSSQVKE